MTRKRKVRLRYYARFADEAGYIRATVCYGGQRKYITTGVTITREQLPRLNSAGFMHIQSAEDMRTDGQLREYSKTAKEVVSVLAAAGLLASLPADEITAAIAERQRQKAEERDARLEAAADADFERRAKEAAKRGHKLQKLTLTEFVLLVQELKESLSPEEYNKLWTKGGGSDGK